MRAVWALLTCVGVGVGGVGVGGCNQPVFIAENRPALGRGAASSAGSASEPVLSDTDLFVLPVHKPIATDQAKALKAEQTQLGLMMPVPWAGLRDFEIEIDWTLKNLELHAEHGPRHDQRRQRVRRL